MDKVTLTISPHTAKHLLYILKSHLRDEYVLMEKVDQIGSKDSSMIVRDRIIASYRMIETLEGAIGGETQEARAMETKEAPSGDKPLEVRERKAPCNGCGEGRSRHANVPHVARGRRDDTGGKDSTER